MDILEKAYLAIEALYPKSSWLIIDHGHGDREPVNQEELVRAILNVCVDVLLESTEGIIDANYDYWHAHISESKAAKFLDVTVNFMEKLREHGGGPPYRRITKGARYTRRDLTIWSNGRRVRG